MKSAIFDKIKKEAPYLGMVLIVLIILFKAVFFKESFLTVLRTAFSIFWLWILPGYAIMLYWQNLSFLERAVAGTAVGMAVSGIGGYYLGLIGLNLKFHAALLPILIIGITLAFLWKQPASESEEKEPAPAQE